MEIIGVKFRHGSRLYYFKPLNNKFKKGDMAVVQTTKGTDCGIVVFGNTDVRDELITVPVKAVLRRATDDDIKTVEHNQIREKEALKICAEKIEQHGLKMSLVDAEYTFESDKILFYFTADLRVDFRELVKDLAGIFRTRIELRQIGVRDKAEMLGGIGICGRELCCRSYLGDFEGVTIKMAKEQGISINSSKMTGACGRLMCCLKNEQYHYEELAKTTPKPGTRVKFSEGIGTVCEANLLTGKLKVKVSETGQTAPTETVHTVDKNDVRIL
ncbi:MAG: stage 0 sporulation family protein [Oscillospiraceae bacterium]|jgi:cell fate regulator YaaT (PSP1 superfamily)|nr:stage 0 sporulation family protein [Oscillospiraceae bacterium]